MARRRAERILTEADYSLCLSSIPWTLVDAVSPRDRVFLVERLKDPAASDAEILRRAGHANGSGGKVPRKPEVRAALTAAFAIATAEAGVTAAWVMTEAKQVYTLASVEKNRKAQLAALTLLGKGVRLGEKDDSPADADATAERIKAQLDEMDERTAA